jgi:cell fate regulator YaaT (PSP1 superfamily)
MPTVIGIRFKDSGKTYHFDPQNIPLVSGDWAIVDTVRGAEMGRVAGETTELAEDQLFGELKPVLRRATEADLEQLMHLQQYEPEALEICKERVAEHTLPMQLIKAEYNFDGSRLTFFFTADKRVDFRALVRDLARTFRTRIELRQVGPRDEAKLLCPISRVSRSKWPRIRTFRSIQAKSAECVDDCFAACRTSMSSILKSKPYSLSVAIGYKQPKGQAM